MPFDPTEIVTTIVGWGIALLSIPVVYIAVLFWLFKRAHKDAGQMMANGFWKQFWANTLTYPAALLWMLVWILALLMLRIFGPLLYVLAVSVIKSFLSMTLPSWDNIQPFNWDIPLPQWLVGG
ncbi:MAG: hypothetical protein WC851_02615 [Candidatus Shapirobacteria bacterium]|jgi:hypothetical protein